MINVALLGKKYQDCIFYVENLSVGETNLSSEPYKTLGGCYNLLKAPIDTVQFDIHTKGSKDAFIISESKSSTRTSIVVNRSESYYSKSLIDTINQNYNWAHTCYIDDIEDPQPLLGLTIDFSIDFCTLKSRQRFQEIIDKATVVFDSRERKSLYEKINTKTPIVFHDQNGIEVNINGEVLLDSQVEPILNLIVNGAGDMYAANFIKNYYKYCIIKSANMAMISTTHLLKKGLNK